MKENNLCTDLDYDKLINDIPESIEVLKEVAGKSATEIVIRNYVDESYFIDTTIKVNKNLVKQEGTFEKKVNIHVDGEVIERTNIKEEFVPKECDNPIMNRLDEISTKEVEVVEISLDEEVIMEEEISLDEEEEVIMEEEPTKEEVKEVPAKEVEEVVEKSIKTDEEIAEMFVKLYRTPRRCRDTIPADDTPFLEFLKSYEGPYASSLSTRGGWHKLMSKEQLEEKKVTLRVLQQLILDEEIASNPSSKGFYIEFKPTSVFCHGKFIDEMSEEEIVEKLKKEFTTPGILTKKSYADFATFLEFLRRKESLLLAKVTIPGTCHTGKEAERVLNGREIELKVVQQLIAEETEISKLGIFEIFTDVMGISYDDAYHKVYEATYDQLYLDGMPKERYDVYFKEALIAIVAGETFEGNVSFNAQDIFRAIRHNLNVLYLGDSYLEDGDPYFEEYLEDLDLEAL